MDGTIFDVFGGQRVLPLEKYRLGLVYTCNSADITIIEGVQKTDIEWDYKGPFLYLVFGF
jgi:hypothetical protein